MNNIRNNPKYKNLFTNKTPKQNRCLEYVLTHTPPNNPKALCENIDKFCVLDKQNWMMNVGPEKGTLIDNLIKEKNAQSFLELGTYMGYSACRFAPLINPNGRFVTIDVNPVTTAKAKAFAEHAGIGNITFLLGGLDANLERLVKEFPNGLDVVFLDHVKSLYISDLNKLEQVGLVREGTRIIGDNLVYPGCPQYFSYMKDNEHYNTRYFDSHLEYSDIKDTFGISDCVKRFK
jgi:catechol O-methyltransferase